MILSLIISYLDEKSNLQYLSINIKKVDFSASFKSLHFLSNSLTEKFIYLIRFNRVFRLTSKLTVVFPIDFSFSITRRMTILKRSNLKIDLITDLTEKKTITENKNNVKIHDDDDSKISFRKCSTNFF